MEWNGHSTIAVLLVIAYFVPTFVAMARVHHQRNAILIMNLFLGWTGLGWIGALIWANTAIPKPITQAPPA